MTINVQFSKSHFKKYQKRLRSRTSINKFYRIQRRERREKTQKRKNGKATNKRNKQQENKNTVTKLKNEE